jgi:hypothetical protein
MRRMTVALAVISVAVFGCAKDLQVNMLVPTQIDPADKRLVLLSGSVWDPQVRSALARKGFSVARFASQRSIERDISPTERERFRQAEARYGLTVYLGPIVDRCLINENVKYGVVTYEITDIRRNEVLFTLERGGGTGPCAWHQDNVFEALADALLQVWHGKRVSD